MSPESTERAAAGLVALLRDTHDRARTPQPLDLIAQPDAIDAALQNRFGLLAADALAAAERELAAWKREGISVLTPLDRDYPTLLRTASTGPPLLFVSGALASDGGSGERPVAVIGSRAATPGGIEAAQAVTRRLVTDGHTIVSGLAAGIDAAAHLTALTDGGRTLAVVGCGLRHCYPPQHGELQRRIAAQGAVVSQFWPEQEPNRGTFPVRNGLMAAMTCATVIVEASERSGTRIQARHALAEGRRVVVLAPVMERAWARALASHPGVTVIGTPAEVSEAIACASPDGSAA